MSSHLVQERLLVRLLGGVLVDDRDQIFAIDAAKDVFTRVLHLIDFDSIFGLNVVNDNLGIIP